MSDNNLMYKTGDNTITNIHELLENKLKQVSLTLSIIAVIGFFLYGFLEFSAGKTNTSLVGIITAFLFIPSSILVIKNKRRVGMIYLILVAMSSAFVMQYFYINDPELNNIITLHTSLICVMIVLVGFLFNSKIGIIISIVIPVGDIIVIMIANEEINTIMDIRLWVVVVLVIIAMGILVYFFSGLFKSLISKAITQAEEQKDLKEQFKSSISLSMNTANKTSNTINTLFTQIKSSTKDMISTIKSIDKNAMQQADAAKSNSTDVKSIINTFNQINESIQSQLKFLSEISDKMNTLTDDVKKVSNISNETKEGFVKLMKSTNEGQKIINQNRDAITKIESSSKDILNLNREIQDISENMNVLSINSSIEAANAGEYGKGFRVLAMEVRSLTHQSSESARKSDEAVKLILERIKEGVEYSQSAEKIFGEIMFDIFNFNEKMAQVTKFTYTHSEFTREIYDLLKDNVSKLRHIANKLSHEIQRSNHILSQSSEIEELSHSTALSINEQVLGGDEILQAVEEVNGVIKENTELTSKMNLLVNSINKSS